MSKLQLKTIFSCFSLIIFHIHRVVYYEFFYYAFKSNWCVISNTISFPIKVMDRRVFTRAVKINQSWVIPEYGIPCWIQLLVKSTTGVPSLSLPDPTPSLIFLLTSLCTVQSERVKQASVWHILQVLKQVIWLLRIIHRLLSAFRPITSVKRNMFAFLVKEFMMLAVSASSSFFSITFKTAAQQNDTKRK